MSAEMALTHLGTLVVATVACVPLGGWGRRPSKSWRREQLEQLLRTIGLVCFPDDKRPPGVFGAGT
jgi:hypothetical protein